MTLSENKASCPYCGEPLTLLVDESDLHNEYIEDCQVCCQPMLVTVFQSGSGGLDIELRREDE